MNIKTRFRTIDNDPPLKIEGSDVSFFWVNNDIRLAAYFIKDDSREIKMALYNLEKGVTVDCWNLDGKDVYDIFSKLGETVNFAEKKL